MQRIEHGEIRDRTLIQWNLSNAGQPSDQYNCSDYALVSGGE